MSTVVAPFPRPMAAQAPRPIAQSPYVRVAMFIGAILTSLLAADWLAGVCVLVLWVVWVGCPKEEGPPVMRLALTYQWLQVSLGIFYSAFTARQLDTMVLSDYRPMVLIGLGCVLSIVLGLRFGVGKGNAGLRPDIPGFTLRRLWILYLLSLFSKGTIIQLAWLFPGIAQGVIAATFAHLGLLFLLLRRYARPELRLKPLLGITAFEIALGLTGFFSGFREPLMMLILVLIESARKLDYRRAISLVLVLVAMLGLAMWWMDIRADYRQDLMGEDELSMASKYNAVSRYSSGFFQKSASGYWSNVDLVVDRVWAVFYPALAIARVPQPIPYEEGALLWEAVRHVFMPRILFPDKPPLTPESEKVRKYTGLWVAGEESSTSIAFGYAAESYIDFGIPWMFLPVFTYGVIVGLIYKRAQSLIKLRELSIGFSTATFWTALFLFERSWAMTLGFFGNLVIFFGALTIFVDRYLLGTGRVQLRVGPRS